MDRQPADQVPAAKFRNDWAGLNYSKVLSRHWWCAHRVTLSYGSLSSAGER